MNVEEASQIILEGNPWKTCKLCGGAGVHAWQSKPCIRCNKQRYTLKPEYQRACEVLDIPLPPPPPKRSLQPGTSLFSLDYETLELDMLKGATAPPTTMMSTSRYHTPSMRSKSWWSGK